MSSPRIAVIGGGIAGSICSTVLRQSGAELTIFDMGRKSAGGRFGAARSQRKANPVDRGAQFMCSSDVGSRFSQVLGFLESRGLVAPWQGRFGIMGTRGGGFLPKEIIDGTVIGGIKADKGTADNEDSSHPDDFCGFLAGGSKSRMYIGTPSMSDICNRLLDAPGIDVRAGSQVTDLHVTPKGWQILCGTSDTNERFDAVVVATHNPALAARAVRRLALEEAGGAGSPADVEQLRSRLTRLAEKLQELRDHHTSPLYTLSAAVPFGSLSTNLPFDAVACPTSQHIQFLSRDASKPGRAADAASEIEYWTAVSSVALAKDLIAKQISEQEAAEQIAGHLLELLKPGLREGSQLPPIASASAKCWRAALTTKTLGLQEDSIGLEPWRLAICGDFIRSSPSPIEAAVLSGLEAGERMVSWLTSN